MSVSAEQPDSTDQPAAWTDPASDVPYTTTEWEALNVALHDHDEAVGQMALRWVASDALIDLSVIAEDPAVSASTRAFAARGLRKARRRIEQARHREASV